MKCIDSDDLTPKARMESFDSNDLTPNMSFNVLEDDLSPAERMKGVGPDDLTPRTQYHVTVCFPEQIHQMIAGAGKDDLEILQGIHQSVSQKLKELQEEIAREEREQAKDWVPGIEAVEDGGKMCQGGMSIGDWDIGRALGCGAFSNVFVAKNRVTNRNEAAKVISKKHILDSGTNYDCFDVCNERDSLLKLPKHKNIAGLTGTLQSTQYIYFFQDLAPGKDLFDFIKLRHQNKRQLPVDAVSQIFSDLTSALAFCHSYDICHRDLKPENIIVNQKDYTVMLVDFGCACPRFDMRKQCVGSMPFIAPECLLGESQDGAQADVWSVGVVLMEMMFGLKALSKALDWDTSPTSTEECGKQLRNLFAEPAQGVTFLRDKLRVEPTFPRGEEFLATMLQPDPQMRPDMQSLHAFTFQSSSL
jgi:serine/threonine protein kinase